MPQSNPHAAQPGSHRANLAGKSAIVTGAALGLGRAYAQALAAAGVHVTLCDIREEVLQLAEELDTPAIALVGDVADAEHVASVVTAATTQYGGIDILINNAGVWGASRADDDLEKSLIDYEHIFGTNFKGEFLFGRAVIPHMLEQGRGGEIVNIATDHMVTCGTPWSVCPGLAACPWGDAPRPTGGGDSMDIYDAAKWALNGLLYGWAKALAPAGIRVNQLCMGATDSNMLRGFHNHDPDPEEVASWMRAEDSARVLLELLQEGPSGRNAQSMNFCVGRPVALEPPHDHRYIIAEQVEVRAVTE